MATPILPYYWPNTIPKQHGTAFKILQLNVLFDNFHHQKVIDLIQKEKPDLIALEEFQQHWLTALEPINKSYPYRVTVPETSPFGVALYSKYPLSDPYIEHYGSFSGVLPPMPSILTLVKIDNQPIRFIVTHPVPPNAFKIRNTQFSIMGAARGRYEPKLIILGDLNSSQWSPFFQALLRQTRFRDSQLGFGVQPSWPSNIWWLKTPIDHVLVSPDILVLNRYIGPDIGSDHLPVLVVLSLKSK